MAARKAKAARANKAGQEGNQNQSETEGTYSVNGSGNPDAKSTAGVSQNAMEFLQGLGKGGGTKVEGNQGDSTEGDGPGGNSATPSEAQSQAQAGQQRGAGQDTSENSASPGSTGEPNADSTAGSSQNAMEFLKSMSAQGGAQNGSDSNASNSAEGKSQDSQDNQAAAQLSGQQDGKGEGQEIAQANGQEVSQEDGQGKTKGNEQEDSQTEDRSQDSQQTEAEEKSSLAEPLTTTSPVSPTETVEESTAGAAQNALEYLTGDNAQSGEEPGNETETGQSEGTLTIKDLMNAQGVGAGTTKPTDEKQVDETKPDKDGE